jgi:RND family efflux transporter MFP subunit
MTGLLMLPAIGMAQMGPMPVSVLPVQQTRISPSLPITGTVHSRNDLQVTAGVDGRLLEVAEEGTQIAAGEVVARIDDTPLKLRQQEQRGLAERARVSLAYLERQLERQESLASTNVTSQTQLDQTRSDRDIARSDLSIAEARLAQIEDELERTVMNAPFAGIVSERFHRAGEDVSRGETLARIIDTESLEVRVFVPLKYSGRIARGDEVPLYGYETEHRGIIRALVPSADVRSQTIEARIDLPEAARRAWSIGQLVSVAVPVRTATETLAVSRDALVLRRDGTFVFRINAENKAERVAVTVGDSEGEWVAVTGALAAGDLVAVRGAESLREGAEVTVLEPAGAATSNAH